MPRLLTVILILLALASGGCSVYFFAVLASLGEGFDPFSLGMILAGLVLAALFLALAFTKR